MERRTIQEEQYKKNNTRRPIQEEQYKKMEQESLRIVKPNQWRNRYLYENERYFMIQPKATLRSK